VHAQTAIGLVLTVEGGGKVLSWINWIWLCFSPFFGHESVILWNVSKCMGSLPYASSSISANHSAHTDQEIHAWYFLRNFLKWCL
jgi:hypothetical protein